MTATGKFPGSEHDPCPDWLLSALADLIYRSTISAVQAAEDLGCSPDYLYTLATLPTNRSGKHRHLPAHRIAPLTRRFGNFVLLDALERQVGRVALQIPLLHPAPSPALQRRQLMARAAEVVQLLAEDTPDGQLLPLLTTLVQQALHYKATITLTPPEVPHG